jgi:Domain of unknown function (DUF4149)
MALLRFLMLLSLVLWIGGIVFFGAVVAPTVFTVLPTHELAGRVVARSLAILHWMGVVCGVVFLLTSMTCSRLAAGSAQPLAPRHVLIVVMIVLTLVSQFAISSRMNAMRAQLGSIDQAAQTDPLRVEFNRLHQWSTRVEMTVLVLGIVVIYLTAARFR